MTTKEFRVKLTGYAAGSKGQYYVETDFAKLFKISHDKARSIFKSVPYTIKENLTSEEADKYKAAIEKIGATCEVENMGHNLDGLSIMDD
ncbi:ribosomal protein L7/L12 [Spartinivicinus ruber]|uniref:ribosomal protein L7/L12 n=1 Tax=Spartinivicinus ruber TaxID=2683272 RepID=UPI0013D16A9F|nr:ribosomal protein L7/L12 [Spartinivicinus ruber]